MANIYDLSDTWNDAGTTFNAIKMNVTDTASASGSLLMDLQVGGTSRFEFAKNATLNLRADTSNASNVAKITLFTGNGNNGTISSGAGGELYVNGTYIRDIFGIRLGNDKSYGWASSSLGSQSADLALFRDAAGTLAQRNSTNAQTFNLYNTYTDASNYERGFMRWNSNVLEIGTEAAGTGTARLLRIFAPNNPSRYWTIDNNGNVSPSITGMGIQGGSHSLTTLYSGSINASTSGNAIMYVRGCFTQSLGSFLSLSGFGHAAKGGFTLTGATGISADAQIGDGNIKGASAYTTATTYIEGGKVTVSGGDGASASAGNAHGGDVYVRGGTGYGTGHDGYVIMDNLPTADPLVSGALWNDSGTLKISA